LFAAVGYGGKIFTSPDGANWSTQFSGITTDLNGVTVGSDGLFAAIGADGKIVTSPDAVTWTQQSANSTCSLRGITSMAEAVH